MVKYVWEVNQASYIHALLSVRDDTPLSGLEQDIDSLRLSGSGCIDSQAVVEAYIRPGHTRDDQLGREGVDHFGREPISCSDPHVARFRVPGCRAGQYQVCSLFQSSLALHSHVQWRN